ncbi:SGNH/GDSL hydrolase family protein [Brevundimonas sp.]|jgi:hypothetical protein|uniref:SGNH/GDSL hydrolase family protein n=1 Tax=Brevundimonas sp. TaxID=1871086 RepID=UPI00378386FB
MPTLAAPQSATYTTVSPQEFVNVVCTGATDLMLVSWVGPAGTSGQRTVRNTTSAGEDIGPLLDGTTVTFTAQSGSPVFTAPAYSPPVQALVSGAGKALAEANRRIIAAQTENPLTRRVPMTVVPDWAPTTAYVNGQVVKQGGFEYVCRTSGTSAGSGGPTGRGFADIVDGTVVWQFNQVQRATAASSEAPTITTTTKPASLTKQYRAIKEASAFAYYGGKAVPSSASGVIFTAVTTLLAGSVVTSAPGQDNFNPCISFVTDALVFAVENANTIGSSRKFFIEIDGQFYSDTPLIGSGGGSFIVFDFTGKEKRQRTIKLYWRRSTPEEFRGVWVQRADAIWAPPVSPRMVVLGDSFVAGSSYSGYTQGQDAASMLGQALGIDDVWNIAKGSCGFVTTAGGTRYTHGERLTDATDPNPDILVVCGNHNDNANSRAVVAAAILSYLQRFRAACPNAFIIFFGTWKSEGMTTQQAIDMEGAAADAIAAFGDSKTAFIPVNSDPSGPWLNGTVSTGSITGVSNAASAVVTCANTAAVGDTAVCHGVQGCAINGILGRVTAASSTQVTLDIDSTSLGAFSTSAGSFVVFNDLITSSDKLHPHPQGIRYLVNRWAQGVRGALRTFLAA